MCGRYYGTGFEPNATYPNLLGITPAEMRPKPEEYNIDLGDPFGEKTVYIKTPMRLEDFDMSLSKETTIKEEKNMMIYIPGMNKDVSESLINELFKISYNVDVQYEESVCGSKPSGVLKLDIPFENVPRLRVSAPMDKNHWLEGIPAVKKVETYNQRVVKVTFIDDTFTKSVCSENDHFDIDVGITICLLKRFMGTNGDDATRNYNKLMNHVHAVMEKNEKERLARIEKKKTLKAKKRKIELKRAAKKLKAKEEQIDIQKQAIIRAHQEMEGLEQ